MILIQPFESALKKINKLYDDFPFKYRELECTDELEKALNTKRKQYEACYYLSKCQKIGKKNNKIVLGITDVDLYVPNLNFVFGLAEKNGYGCIISTRRLDERGLLKERMLKEAFHEIGHVVGLEHCLNNNCVMYFSNSLSDTDRKTGWFCKDCFDDLKQKMRSDPLD